MYTYLLNKNKFPAAGKHRRGVKMNSVIGLLLVLLAAFILWLLAIAPQMIDRPDLARFKKYDFAHRGLHNQKQGVPENSVAAFKLAAQHGFGIELDLRLSKDGQVVVFHDENLKRMCGVDKELSQLSFRELEAFSLAGSEETIPSFAQVLNAVGHSVPIIVEIKSHNPTAEICEKVWDILKNYDGLYCVESFNPLIVKWFKDHQPQVVRGQLMEGLKKGKELTGLQAFLGRNLFSNFLTRPNFEAYDHHSRSRPSMWLAKHLLGMTEVSWTVRDPDTYSSLKSKDCIIIFEGFIPISDINKEDNVKHKVATGAMLISQLPPGGIPKNKEVKR